MNNEDPIVIGSSLLYNRPFLGKLKTKGVVLWNLFGKKRLVRYGIRS